MNPRLYPALLAAVLASLIALMLWIGLNEVFI
jgi:hypothetical protein